MKVIKLKELVGQVAEINEEEEEDKKKKHAVVRRTIDLMK